MGINHDLFYSNRASTVRRAVFEGQAYLAADNFTLTSSGTRDIYVVTGESGAVINSLRTLTESGDYTLSLYEGATATGGSALTLVNADRSTTAAPAPASVAVTDPTISDVGTLILSSSFGGSNSGNTTNEFGIDIPFILAGSTGYIFRWTHNGSGARDFTVTGSFFKDNREHK